MPDGISVERQTLGSVNWIRSIGEYTVVFLYQKLRLRKIRCKVF